MEAMDIEQLGSALEAERKRCLQLERRIEELYTENARLRELAKSVFEIYAIK